MKRKSLLPQSTAKSFWPNSSEKGSKTKKWKIKELSSNHTMPLSTSIEADFSLTDFSSLKSVLTIILTLIKKKIAANTMTLVWNMRISVVISAMKESTKWAPKSKKRVSTVRLCLIHIVHKMKCLHSEILKNILMSESIRVQSGHSTAATTTQQTNTLFFVVFRKSYCLSLLLSPRQATNLPLILSASSTVKSMGSTELRMFWWKDLHPSPKESPKAVSIHLFAKQPQKKAAKDLWNLK